MDVNDLTREYEAPLDDSFDVRLPTICCCGGTRAAYKCAELQPIRLPLRFRRERGHDSLEARIAGRIIILLERGRVLRLRYKFFEARIVAQWVPPGMQTQLTVGNWRVHGHDFLQLLEREIFFTRPGVGDR
ncbi:MAG: hypothetical protein DME45_10535 [Verrucomicrobia bacterium]|nr:MAG: hypothetical protein DME45_10535 [Verrucomicrobiota bacterium]